MIGIGNKINSFTNLYFKEYRKEVKLGTLKFDDDHTAFTFFLIEKIVENFAGVGELLKLSEKDGMSFLKNSLYILLRGVLSDVIIIFWIFNNDTLITDENEMIKSKVNELKRDHIKYHISYLQRMESLKLLPKEEKIFEISILNNHYRHLITEDINETLNNNIKENSTPISKMLNESNKHNAILVEVYKTYFLLSKVEHTGEFTRMILEKTYSNENPMDDYLKNSIQAIDNTIKIFAPIFLTRNEFVDELRAFKVIE